MSVAFEWFIIVAFFISFIRPTLVTIKSLQTFIGEKAAIEAVSLLSKDVTNERIHKQIKDLVTAQDPKHTIFRRFKIEFDDWSISTFGLLGIYRQFDSNQVKPNSYLDELNFIRAFLTSSGEDDCLNSTEIRIILKSLYYHAIFNHELLSAEEKDLLEIVLHGYVMKIQEVDFPNISFETVHKAYDFPLFTNYSNSFLKLESTVPSISGKGKNEAELSEPYFYFSLKKVLKSDPRNSKSVRNDNSLDFLKPVYRHHTDQFRILYHDVAATLIKWDTKTPPNNIPSSIQLPSKDFLTKFCSSAFISNVPTFPFQSHRSANLEFFSVNIFSLFMKHVMMFLKQVQAQERRISVAIDNRINIQLVEILDNGLETLKDIKDIILMAEHVPKEQLELFDTLFNIISISIFQMRNNIPFEKVNLYLEKVSKVKLLDYSLHSRSPLDFGTQKSFELFVVYLLESFFESPPKNFECWTNSYLPIENDLSSILKEEVIGKPLRDAIIAHFNSFALYLFNKRRLFDFSRYNKDDGYVRRIAIADLLKTPGLPIDANAKIRDLLRDELTACGYDPGTATSAINMLVYMKSKDLEAEAGMNPNIPFKKMTPDQIKNRNK